MSVASADSAPPDRLRYVKVSCDGLDITDLLRASAVEASYDLWLDDDVDDGLRAEAACIRLNCWDYAHVREGVRGGAAAPSRGETTKTTTEGGGAGVSHVACATRIVRRGEDRAGTGTAADALLGEGPAAAQEEAAPPPPPVLTSPPPDVLLLLIDPISREHFDRSLPRTAGLLRRLGLVQFDGYTTVGDNSGPNQAALYSGIPLRSRDGVSIHGRKSDGGANWLWDVLRDDGDYVTLKAEDGCVENSNMIQSIRPNVTHGDAVQKMICFDFDRPNCLGVERAAVRLLDYVRSFIGEYSGRAGAENEHRRRPWAAFVHMIDSHEDTMVLAGLLDEPLYNFISWFYDTFIKEKRSDAMFVVTSDHGLHYGPFFQTTAGERERSQPILHIRPPSMLGQQVLETLNRNSRMTTTPFDLHETLINVTLNAASSKSVVGTSLLTDLPEERRSCRTTPGIPSNHCDVVENSGSNIPVSVNSKTANACRPSIPPPLPVLSFFSDINMDHRQKISSNIRGNLSVNALDSSILSIILGKNCECATKSKCDWNSSSVHPLGFGGADQLGQNYVAAHDCIGKPWKMDMHAVYSDNTSVHTHYLREESVSNDMLLSWDWQWVHCGSVHRLVPVCQCHKVR